ncbi:MAG TPA: hypothetical protein PK129_08375 [Cellvibrionaceae bacterium]|nr:hypothetical protein [Cellvibrionaceae bacterium]
MEKYWLYWRRGWWAWLLSAILNLSVAVLVFPLAWFFWGNEKVYWIASGFVWLIIGAPVWGWIFEVFAKNSDRF